MLPPPPAKQGGFSLVELSVVLVILGLLVGGVLSGQSLIRAAELRSVSTDYQRFYAATKTFQDKYFSLPGDFRDASKFWGLRNTVTTNCISASGIAASAGGQTCDGNGDGRLNNAAAATETAEIFQFWVHLALAGLVEGTYTGNAGSGGTQHSIVGTNVAKSKLNNAGWSIFYTGPLATINYYTNDYGNLMYIGAASTTTITYSPLFAPQDAWNIDTKMDDGRPGTGTIFAMEWGSFASAATSAGRCTTSTSTTDYAGTYKLDNTAGNCSLIFMKAF